MHHTAVKGMHDLLPPDSARWAAVETAARRVFARYGFAEIRTPVVEKSALFVRGLGDASDIVGKEMYTFVDKGDESLTLRPEGTAPVVRAYVEHALYQTDPQAKLFYFSPMFRRERPQKGRYRQFHQIGAELFGTASPQADAEVITLLVRLLESVGVQGAQLELNSLGCAACRPAYQSALRTFLAGVAEALCGDCQRRLHTNPLRVLDCKNPSCQERLGGAPGIAASWCAECRTHFDAVQDALALAGVAFRLNPRIARGLDYYVRTAFEITSDQLGAQSALCGGGRYDGLVRALGGPDVPGVGFGIGMERLMLLLADTQPAPLPPSVFVAALGEAPRRAAWAVIEQLRAADWCVEWDYEDRSLKSQMKRADRLGAVHVVLLGSDELARAEVTVRNMSTKAQVAVPLATVVEHFHQIRNHT